MRHVWLPWAIAGAARVVAAAPAPARPAFLINERRSMACLPLWMLLRNKCCRTDGNPFTAADATLHGRPSKSSICNRGRAARPVIFIVGCHYVAAVGKAHSCAL